MTGLESHISIFQICNTAVSNEEPQDSYVLNYVQRKIWDIKAIVHFENSGQKQLYQTEANILYKRTNRMAIQWLQTQESAPPEIKIFLNSGVIFLTEELGICWFQVLQVCVTIFLG